MNPEQGSLSIHIGSQGRQDFGHQIAHVSLSVGSGLKVLENDHENVEKNLVMQELTPLEDSGVETTLLRS